VNFKFNKEKYNLYKNNLSFSELKVVRTDGAMFEKMSGAVIPKRFWMNASDFDKKAVAYSVIVDGEVASTAFSAFILEGELEIGIETVSCFQGKGYAIAACSALIDYCLKEGFEPVWSCRFENTSSYNLAQKLGFEPTIYWPFYRLID
jgi:RimJ/RimL family protein N-acetyltransferase